MRQHGLNLAILTMVTGSGGLGPPVDFRFDQGSLASYTLVDDTPTIRIVPIYDLNDGAEKTEWFCVRSRHWTGNTPVFVVEKIKLWPTYDTDMWFGAWATSPDTDSWTLFDNFTVGVSDYEFSHNTAFPSGTIYVALWPMYPFSRTQRLMSNWLANALVSDTTSSTDGVIDLTSAILPDAYERGISNLPYYGFKISSGAGTKNIAILSARLHACEGAGGFAFEAAINWLLGGSDLANFMLDWFDFYVYPCLYPINVINGHARDLWTDPTIDLNTLWDTTGTHEFVDTFKTAMTADTGGAIEVGLDFHALASSALTIGDVQDGADAMLVAFRDKMLALDAGYSLLEEILIHSLTYWWINTLGANLALYVEQGMSKTRSVANWKTYGENNMAALARMLVDGRFTQGPGVGSRDFNGTTDRIDWASVFDTAGSALTISAWVNMDAYIANPLSAYVLGNHRSGDAAYGTVLAIAWSGRLIFFRNGATGLARYSLAANPVGTGAWVHILVTHSGSMTDYTTINLYINNVDRSDNTDAVNGAGEYAASGKWSIGGRIFDDARNVNGKIAQVGVWNRVLDATERANLAAGYAPDLAAPSGLQFYFKGNTAALDNEIGGADGTADGTTQLTGVGTGPGIIYG